MHQNILETLYQKLKKHQIMNLNYKLKYSIHIAIQKKIIVIQYFRYIYQNTGLHTFEMYGNIFPYFDHFKYISLLT